MIYARSTISFNIILQVYKQGAQHVARNAVFDGVRSLNSTNVSVGPSRKTKRKIIQQKKTAILRPLLPPARCVQLVTNIGHTNIIARAWDDPG